MANNMIIGSLYEDEQVRGAVFADRRNIELLVEVNCPYLRNLAKNAKKELTEFVASYYENSHRSDSSWCMMVGRPWTIETIRGWILEGGIGERMALIYRGDDVWSTLENDSGSIKERIWEVGPESRIKELTIVRRFHVKSD